MAHYLIVNADITDLDLLNKYSKAAGATLAGRPVKVLIATNDAVTLEGTPAGSRVVLIEFADRAALDDWYQSPEYQAIIGMRLEATNGFAFVAQGLG